MRFRSLITLAFTIACAFAIAGCADNAMWGNNGEDDDDANEQEVTMDQLPAAVRAAFTREAGNGQIQEVERTTSKGRTTYEADMLIDGKTWEVMVDEDGKLLGKKADDKDDDGEDDDDDAPMKPARTPATAPAQR